MSKTSSEIPIKLRFRDKSPPLILNYFEQAVPPRSFTVVIPVGGTERDAVLYSATTIETDETINRLRGPRADRDGRLVIAHPVEGGTEIGSRFFERGPGGSLGDITIPDMPKGKYDRIPTFVLDLSKGMTTTQESFLSYGLRAALSDAMARSDSPNWRQTADALDPQGLLRTGIASVDIDPVTLNLEQIARGPEYRQRTDNMPDFRFEETNKLIETVKRFPMTMASAWPNLRADDRLFGTALQRIPNLANAIEQGDGLSAARHWGQFQWLMDRGRKLANSSFEPGRNDPSGPTVRLLRGQGAGVTFYNDVAGQNGMIDTLIERSANPRAHDRHRALFPDYAGTPFWDTILHPEKITERAHGRTLSELDEIFDRSPKLATDLPVLALPNGVMATASGLQTVLEKAKSRRTDEFAALRQRTETLMLKFEQATTISRNQRYTPALDTLRRGLETLDRVNEPSTRLANLKPKQTFSGRLIDAPKKFKFKSTAGLAGRIELSTGERIDFVLFGTSAHSADLFKADQGISLLGNIATYQDRPQIKAISIAKNRDHDLKRTQAVVEL